jgi:broad-specificity NMP kinase
LSTELAQELAKTEKLTREKDEQTAEYEARCEQLKQSLVIKKTLLYWT